MIKVSDLVTELITVLGDDEVAFPELKDSMFSVFDVDELLNYVGNVVDLPTKATPDRKTAYRDNVTIRAGLY